MQMPSILPIAASDSPQYALDRSSAHNRPNIDVVEVDDNLASFLLPPSRTKAGCLWRLCFPAALEASNLLVTHPYNCMPHGKKDDKFPSQIRHETLPFVHLSTSRARNSNVKDHLPMWVTIRSSQPAADSPRSNEGAASLPTAGANTTHAQHYQSLYTISDDTPLDLLQPVLLRSDGTLDHLAPQPLRMLVVHFTSAFPAGSTDDAHAELLRVQPCLSPGADPQWWAQQLKDARPKPPPIGGQGGGDRAASKRSRNRDTRAAQDELNLKRLVLGQLGALARAGHVPVPQPGAVFWLAHTQSMPLCDPCCMPSMAQVQAAKEATKAAAGGAAGGGCTPPLSQPILRQESAKAIKDTHRLAVTLPSPTCPAAAGTLVHYTPHAQALSPPIAVKSFTKADDWSEQAAVGFATAEHVLTFTDVQQVLRNVGRRVPAWGKLQPPSVAENSAAAALLSLVTT